MRIERQRILITGASSGIGRALAWELARRDTVLMLAARNEQALNELSHDLNLACPQAAIPLAIKCDVTKCDEVHQMVEQCNQELGGLDILINNAGISAYGDSARTQREDFHQLMEINYFGALNCLLEVLPCMRHQAQGLIVNIASVAAIHGIPYLGAYGASKAALVAFSQSLRAELYGSGVSIMNVYPNYTHTQLFDREKLVGGAHRPQHAYASAESVARKIVRAIVSNRRDLILTSRGKALHLLQGIWPSFVENEMQQIAQDLREHKEG